MSSVNSPLTFLMIYPQSYVFFYLKPHPLNSYKFFSIRSGVPVFTLILFLG